MMIVHDLTMLIVGSNEETYFEQIEWLKNHGGFVYPQKGVLQTEISHVFISESFEREFIERFYKEVTTDESVMDSLC
jgi:hypothetical protein